jgi:hypothetical protein
LSSGSSKLKPAIIVAVIGGIFVLIAAIIPLFVDKPIIVKFAPTDTLSLKPTAQALLTTSMAAATSMPTAIFSQTQMPNNASEPTIPPPLPTISPTEIVRVTKMDGAVFDLDQINILQTMFFGPGEGVVNFPDTSIDYLSLLMDPTMILEIPLDKIDNVLLSPAGTDQPSGSLVWRTGPIAVVQLANGQKYHGMLTLPFQNRGGILNAFEGQTVVGGFSSSFKIFIQDINHITFSQDKTGQNVASVVAKDGTVTDNISQFEFLISGVNEQLGEVQDDYIGLGIGNNNVKVPLVDIQSIERSNDKFELLSRTGGKLTGAIGDDFMVLGKTTKYGMPAEFLCSFKDIQSVVFK